jgi:hypothetical protein
MPYINKKEKLKTIIFLLIFMPLQYNLINPLLIELFLQLGSKYLDTSGKADSLMDYWHIFNEEKAIELSQKATIRRPNRTGKLEASWYFTIQAGY